jgi:hypothetical protein
VSVLPETATVYWRPRLDAARLHRRERGGTLSTVAHTIPFAGVAALMLALEPLSFPVAAMALVHAYGIPALYASRGAAVVRPRPRGDDAPERTALGLLGDLLGHETRALHARTGLALERGGLGTWLVGEAGALLVRPGGRRVDCWCVKVDAELPSADRTAHLLLALREDEQGFATVANLAFSGAVWRVRRRLRPAMRPALDAAVLARMSNGEG